MSLPLEQDTIMCRNCSAKVLVRQKSQWSPYTLISVLIVIFLFGIWSLFIFPCVLPLTRAVSRSCNRCKRVLQIRYPHSPVSLQDQIFTWKWGECVLVISRKYLLITTAITAIFLFLMVPESPEAPPRIYIQTTWQQYLQDCGSEVLIRNPIKASTNFEEKYEGKTINWKGYVMSVRQNRGLFIFDHAHVILLQMVPSQTGIHADLIMSFSKQMYRKNKEVIDGLKKGQEVGFNASFVMMGNEHSLHHLHGESIVKLEGFKEIGKHVHSVNERYNPQRKGQISRVT